MLSSDDKIDSSDDGKVDINTMIKQFATNQNALEGGGNAFAEGVLANLGDIESSEECPICLDVMQSPMIIPVCMHKWCVIL